MFYFTAQETGYSLTDDELNRAFLRFKDLADKKKELTSLDLASIVNDEIRDVNIRRYELVGMQVRRLVRGSGLVLRRAIAYSGWRRRARARQAPVLTCVCVLSSLQPTAKPLSVSPMASMRGLVMPTYTYIYIDI